MRITLFWKRNFISRENGDGSFILGNNQGAFAYFAENPTSKYQGLFIQKKDDVFRTIESIQAPGTMSSISSNFHSVVRSRGPIIERYLLPHHYESLCYELSENADVTVTLDCRKANDFRQFGRYYSVKTNEHVTVIEFVKKTDYREDKSHDVEEYRIYIAVRSNAPASTIGNWVKREYTLDKYRNSVSERYVYEALKLKASKMIFAVAFDEASAVEEAEFLYHNLEQLQRDQKEVLNHFTTEKIELAAAETALYSLVAKNGVYAGLPWFFQEWSRDSLVSSIGLDMMLRKKIILNYLRKIGGDGRLSTNQDSTLGCSDSIGWLFLRAKQVYFEGGFTRSEVKEITAALKDSLERQQRNYGRDGLIFSGKNESWMDTSWNDSGREGFPIEIQALTLAAYDFLALLTKDRRVRLQESKIKRKVRQLFWNSKFLNDLSNDSTVRPNIFIAAYAYPQLLTGKEWEICFASTLQKLWLEWGGLATIDRNHALFQKSYSGEDNRSYHRGDSWFWINNIAAIAMAQVNKQKFESYIKRIRDASVNDLLWKGAIGCSSELSSASEQKAEGCLSQAWSAATLIELLKST